MDGQRELGNQGDQSALGLSLEHRQLLQTIEKAVALRYDGYDGPERDEPAERPANNSLGNLCAVLATDMPPLDEGFRGQLLARLQNELYGPSRVDALATAAKVDNQSINAGHEPPSGARKSLPIFKDFAEHLKRGFPGLPARRQSQSRSHSQGQGRLTSMVLALAGASLMLALLIGMAAMLRIRQEVGRSDLTPTPGISSTPGAVPDSSHLAPSMQPFMTLKSRAAKLMAWSPDGSILAAAEIRNAEYPAQSPVVGPGVIVQSYKVSLWDGGTGSLVKSISVLNLKSLVWSPDSSMLALGLDENTVKLLDRSGEDLAILSTPMPDEQQARLAGWGGATFGNAGWLDARSLAWSPDGSMLASASGEPFATDPVSREGVIRIWDVSSGKLVRSIKTPEWTTEVAWSPDGRNLVAGLNGRLIVFDAATGTQLHELIDQETVNGRPAPLGYFAISPDGHTLAVAADLFVELWDLASGKRVRRLPGAITERMFPVPVGTDVPGRPTATVASQPTVTLSAGQEEDGMLWSAVRTVAWSPDGRELATNDGGAIRIWDAATGKRVRTIARQAGLFTWSVDGKVLTDLDSNALIREDGEGRGGTITFWDLATGETLRTILEGKAYNFAWSPDGSSLAISTVDGMQLWGVGPRVPTGTAVAQVTSAAPTPESQLACGSWQIVESQTEGIEGVGHSRLLAISATSPDDAWAVGFHSDRPVDGGLIDGFSSKGKVQTLIKRWDGVRWSKVPSPETFGNSYLLGVTASDSRHAWAVGYRVSPSYGGGNMQESLILEWDGSSWQVMPIISVQGADNRLTAVTALAPDDVWAVGSFGQDADFNGDLAHTVIMHFDGKAWELTLGPTPGAYGNHLTAVSAVSRDDVWAAGFQRVDRVDRTQMLPLLLRWNGTEWAVVTNPAEGDKAQIMALSGVAALPGSAWVTGGTVGTGGSNDVGGGSWQVRQVTEDGQPRTTSPYLLGGEVTDLYLSGVMARSPSDVWAVGSIGRDKTGTAAPPQQPPHDTLVLHWNGQDWGLVDSSGVQGVDNELSAIAPVPGMSGGSGGHLWAVGSSGSENGRVPLILRYNVCATSGAPESTGTTQALPAVPAVTTLPAVTGPSPTPTPTPVGPTCGLIWSQVPVPAPGPLTDVAVISRSDVWAVGSTEGTASNTLTTHWDGFTWRLVPSPNVGTGSNRLYSVAALSSNDVWAVGAYSDTAGAGSTDRVLILHWNGVEWKIVQSPEPQGSTSSRLSAVAGVSKNDVWAVGSYGLPSKEPQLSPPGRTLIQHWDGTRWRIVASPSPGDSNSLADLAVVSKNDIWTVGGYEEEDVEFIGAGKTLTLHWNGTRWTHVPSPNPQTWISALSGVAAMSANDIWAVGGDNGGEHVDPLTMRWDGKQWSIVPSPPSTSHNGGSIVAAEAIATNEVWAVGSDTWTPFGLRWNGNSWEGTTIPTQNRDGTYLSAWLSAIEANSPGDIWAVGGSGVPGNGATAFALHYGDVPCVTPRVAATPTAGAAATVTRAGATLPARPSAAEPTPRPVCWTWSPVPGSDEGDKAGILSALSVISASDIWAAGSAGSQGGESTLIIHWDGMSWMRVPSPNVPGAAASVITALGAISKDDVWAVGNYLTADKSAGKSLAMHWEGKQWSIVTSPSSNLGQYSYLTSVSSISRNDVWAAGYRSFYEGGGDMGGATLILHWDGKSWSEVRSPNVGQYSNTLRSMAFTGKDDIWAVGDYSKGSPNYGTLVIHWDGKAWSVVPSPNPSDTDSKLLDVVALSKDDVWALGEYTAPTFGYAYYTFSMMQHWDGARWNVIVPGKRSIASRLTTLAAPARDNIWAIGSGLTSAHWDGAQWTELKPDFGDQWRGMESAGIRGAVALSSAEVLTVGTGVGRFSAKNGACTAPEVEVILPTPLPAPPPVPTAAPAAVP